MTTSVSLRFVLMAIIRSLIVYLCTVLYIHTTCIVRSTYGYNLGTGRYVTLKGEQVTGSYFGFSVAIDDDSNIFVGSPRDNDTDLPGVDSPGRMYLCNGTGHCIPIHIDDNAGNDTIAGVKIKHGKHHQWLGATIGLPPQNSQRGIVTCAPRWYNAEYAKSFDNFMKGLCYEIPTDLTTSEILKLMSAPAASDYTVRIGADVYYRYGFSQMGSSVHYTRRNADLLLGAPGVNHWTGGFVKVERSRFRSSWKYMEQNLEDIENTQSQFAGYALTSGVYFADGIEYYAIGMPRADLVGQVLLFKSTGDKYKLETPDAVLEGLYAGSNTSLPVNSFFGSVLCTADFNSDGRDDLLVGAPLYAPTGHVDTGMVLVFVGATKGPTFSNGHKALEGDLAPSGRFGMAISDIGDINLDLFKDVAIGAPYADDLKGRVYIYNGYSGGVWHKYSQLIMAKTINTGLAGFGAAISNGKDVNGDTVNDVVIGAFLNDSAVILFGQPVIDLGPSLSVRRSKVSQIFYIQQNETQASVRVCFVYIFKQCSEITVKITVALDVDRGINSRLLFKDSQSHVHHMSIKLFHGEPDCSHTSIAVVKSTHDIISPIRITANYSMPENDVRCSTPIPPISKRFDGDQAANFRENLEEVLYFYNNCPNNTCTTDLHLYVSASYVNVNQYFILGTDDLTFNIKITKDFDSSYSSVMHLVFPYFINYKRYKQVSGSTDVTCTKIANIAEETQEGEGVMDYAREAAELTKEERMLSCTFGNPVTDSSGVEFNIFLQVPVYLPAMMFDTRFWVTSLSQELRKEDNAHNMTLQLRHQCDLSLIGIPVDESIRNEVTGSQEFKHLYVLENHGPSPLQEVAISLHHPYSHNDGDTKLYLKKSEVKCRYPCDVTCHVIEPSVVPRISSYINGKMTIWQSTKPLTEISQLDCSQDDCPYFWCYIKNIPASHSAELTLTYSVTGGFPASTLLVSRAHATVNTSQYVSTVETLKSKVTTRILSRIPEPEGIAWWIIVVSIICGLLLIVLMVFILYKVGFFKRQTRDTMHQRLADEQKTEKKQVDKDSFTDSEHDKLDDKNDEVNM